MSKVTTLTPFIPSLYYSCLPEPVLTSHLWMMSLCVQKVRDELRSHHFRPAYVSVCVVCVCGVIVLCGDFKWCLSVCILHEYVICVFGCLV